MDFFNAQPESGPLSLVELSAKPDMRSCNQIWVRTDKRKLDDICPPSARSRGRSKKRKRTTRQIDPHMEKPTASRQTSPRALQ